MSTPLTMNAVLNAVNLRGGTGGMRERPMTVQVDTTPGGTRKYLVCKVTSWEVTLLRPLATRYRLVYEGEDIGKAIDRYNRI